jgi:predicted dehydrogenase
LIGRVVQDVVTFPPRKQARLQGTKGSIEWINSYNKEGDAVIYYKSDGFKQINFIPKKRADDFIEELKHIQEQLEFSSESSGIGLERGLETMLVLAGAHISDSKNCRIKIDYQKGFNLSAICI